MKIGCVLGLVVVTVAMLPGGLRAQVESGPGAGSGVKPLKVVALIKDEADKEIDFAVRARTSPPFSSSWRRTNLIVR